MRTERWARYAGTGLGVVGGFVLGYAMVRTGEIKPPASAIWNSRATPIREISRMAST